MKFIDYAKSQEHFPTTDIRGLMWKQPFASLMLHDKVETRGWTTNYRGWVLIGASKAVYGRKKLLHISGTLFAETIIPSILETDPTKDITGKAIAIGRLVGCRKLKESDEHKAFVFCRDGLYAHIYEYVKAIEPFPIQGKLGWMKLTEEQINQINIL